MNFRIGRIFVMGHGPVESAKNASAWYNEGECFEEKGNEDIFNDCSNSGCYIACHLF